MRYSVENFITVLFLIITEAWFLHDIYTSNASWDSSIAFLAAFSALFAKDYVKVRFNIAQPANEHDKALFQQFLSELPVEPTINMLKDYDFGNSFKSAQMQPLFRFADTWNDVNREFLDSALEKKRKVILTAAQALSMEFARLTVPVGNGDFSSVFPDRLRADGPRPQFVVDDAKALNKIARTFAPLYESFVRSGRKKLLS